MSTPIGAKYDSGKSRLDLLPARALVAIGHVLAYGAAKYVPDGWMHVPDAKPRYRAAAMRHFLAMLDGEAYDEESGLLHVAHFATNALFLCWLELRDLPVRKAEP